MQRTASASLYRESGAFQIERALVFARSWQFVALESDFAETGDYVAETLAGYPVVVVRTKDGDLRGFHNVCRHRAGPLVSEARGRCAGEFVCRYHGWRYALDGRLRSAVDFGPVEGFDPREFGLHPIRVETWRGLVFVNLQASAAPLMKSLAPVEAVWRERGLQVPSRSLRRTHTIDCNWKVYVENYLESYHIPFLHPGLAEEVDCGDLTIEVRGDVVLQEAAAKGGANQGLWAWVWPNLALNVYRGGLMVERMSPDGHERTRLDYLYLHDFEDEAAAEPMLQASARTTAEDIWVCERVQQNLAAGIYDHGVLSPRHENAVAWFQARVAESHG